VIEVHGQSYETLVDAAAAFGVSTKTVRRWIRRGIVDEPPTVVYGLRTIAVFPDEYMARAGEQLAAHRRQAKESIGGPLPPR
jgi:hypothetical protein